MQVPMLQSGGANTGQPSQQPLEPHEVEPSLHSSVEAQDCAGPQSRPHAGSAASTNPLQSSSLPFVHDSRAPGCTVASNGAQSPPGMPWHCCGR